MYIYIYIYLPACHSQDKSNAADRSERNDTTEYGTAARFINTIAVRAGTVKDTYRCGSACARTKEKGAGEVVSCA
jgi:hypothetical protein